MNAPPTSPSPDNSNDAFRDRADAFLHFIASEGSARDLTTQWGPYRGFDVHGLAFLAVGEDVTRGRELLNGTLDMIDENLAGERANPEDKWHLADFALHPLIRAWFLYREKHLPGDPIWERIAATARGFLFHFGDLSENHNLLHLAAHHLTLQAWPDAQVTESLETSRDGILAWIDDWVRRGSGEWGADIYYNVNLLALLNLYDFSDDPRIRSNAHTALDLFALDEALDSFRGSVAGAARRSYSVYRMDLRESPSRPLHYLWFGLEDLDAPFNLNFIGGVLEAATSSYRPPAPVAWIARSGAPDESGTTHRVGLWADQANPGDHIGKHNHRLPHAMLSVTNTPGGEGGYSEQIWQMTLGESAPVFSNHPSLENSHTWVLRDQGREHKNLADGLAHYRDSAPGLDAAPRRVDGTPWFWGHANMPPGHPGELRPGYWQGNAHHPRGYGRGRAAFLIYDIPPDDPLPWVHLFLPTRAFDEVVATGRWIFLRHGSGYGAIWCSAPPTFTSTGFWAGCEATIEAPRCAIFALIGDPTTDASFSSFQSAARQCAPAWNDEELSAVVPGESERVCVTHSRGPAIGDRPVNTLGARIATRWGSLPLGETSLTLDTPVGSCRISL